MTAYVPIPDSDIDPDSPGTTTLFTRLRDNAIAIAEGASGAPKVQNPAIADGAITRAKLNGGITAGNSYPNASTDSASSTNTNQSYVEIKNSRVLQSGTYRIFFTLSAVGGGSNTVFAKIYKNGVPIGTERSTITSASFTEDIACLAGDTIQIFARKNGGINDASVSNFKFGMNTINLIAPPLNPIEIGER